MAVPAVAVRPSLAVAFVLSAGACIEPNRRVGSGDSSPDVVQDVEVVEEATADTQPLEAEVSLECVLDDECRASTTPCYSTVCRDNRCVELPAVSGSSCDDLDPCTGDGSCVDGACQPGPVKEDGSECDDGLRCNGIATCVDGLCAIPLPPTCAPSDNPCAAGAACSEEAGGVCVDLPVEDARACQGPADALDPASWRCDGGRCVPADMVLVPAGVFTMGCPDDPQSIHCSADDNATHEVRMSAFAIDRAEVHEQLYRRCLADSEGRGLSCPERPEGVGAPQRDVDPLRWVDFVTAEAVCHYFGKRLCSEAEWEYAARGPGDAFYPWGNLPPTCERATFFDEGGPGCGEGKPSAVGVKPAGASRFGALDMAGNVSEWVADFYRADAYGARAGSLPTDPVESVPNAQQSHVVRGGSFRDGIAPLRVFVRAQRGAEVYQDDLGVRCCLSLTDP